MYRLEKLKETGFKASVDCILIIGVNRAEEGPHGMRVVGWPCMNVNR